MTRGKLLIGLIVLAMVIQFIRPDRNSNRRKSDLDITKHYAVPNEVGAIFLQSCYDCHSNYTEYPWYAEVQPFGWWLDSHIREGKEKLNFSEFGTYSSRKQRSKLRAIKSSITDGTMPLSSYLIIHRNAELSEVEKEKIANWIDSIQNGLSR